MIDYKAEFENEYTYGNWWDIRGNPFTISCIEPKYFNEMESEDNNVIPGETYSDVPPLSCAYCSHFDIRHMKGKGECKDCALYCERYRSYRLTPTFKVNSFIGIDAVCEGCSRRFKEDTMLPMKRMDLNNKEVKMCYECVMSIFFGD